MKNTIPLVIAVMLGLAAVFAVSRTIARNRGDEVQKISVLVANKNMAAGDEVRNDDISTMLIQREAFIPHQHVRAENSNWVAGQRLQRSVAKGGFIMIDDVVSQGRGLASEIADGEWCVPVHFADSSLIDSVQSGDDIAIVMIVQDAMATGRTDDEGVAEYVKVQTARVLFPSISVLRKTQDGILVSLNPQEAQRLLMAQLNAPLYPMLRKTGDSMHRSVQPGRGVTTLALSEEALVQRDSATTGL